MVVKAVEENLVKKKVKKLSTFHFNYQYKEFKVFTISNIKRINNKFCCHILLPLSGNISLNQGPKNNLRPFDSNELNVSRIKYQRPSFEN